MLVLMATSATSPGSPLRAEDLLSDSSEAPGLNQVSSEVTSQLYASLHLSRQAEATARAQLYLPTTSPPPHEMVDGLAQELSRSLSVGLENNLKKKDGSKHIFEMESVRGQLQSMLQNSRDAAYRDPVTPGPGSERREEDSFDSDSTATLLNTQPLQDLSPSSSAQALEELFPRYASLRPGPPINPPDFQGLKDALDSEHTRRKHCERHIQSLQTRVLELQQQLVVAVTADRKKDVMIEQLDKTLARVVEGWNRHEAERAEVLRGLQEERQAAEFTRSKQQEARYESQRLQLESELAVRLEQQVTERLAQAQESSLRQAASLREQHRLAREQARVRDLQSGRQQLEEQRAELVERLQAMLQAHWEEANQLLSAPTLPANPPVPTTSPSSPGPQEPEKGERRLWPLPPVAVALKPALQQSREAGEEALGGPPPVLCGSSTDLGLLLGPSFQSQHSFQPLEPKLTSSSAGTFHPDHRPERPFPEEDPGSDGDSFLKQGLPPPSQLEGLKHFLQQLLDTVPQNSEAPSVDLLPPKSGPLAVPSWEDAPRVPHLPPPVHKTKVPLAMASSLFRAHELPSSQSQSSGPSGSSPDTGGDGLAPVGQLMDVSQLLRLYQARGWGALPAEDLLLYLKRQEHGRTDSRGDNVPRRNTDSRLGEIPRKEVLPRRLAPAPKTEKPPVRRKGGHPAPSSARSRGGIWR